jgi:hypothetical protein
VYVWVTYIQARLTSGKFKIKSLREGTSKRIVFLRRKDKNIIIRRPIYNIVRIGTLEETLHNTEHQWQYISQIDLKLSLKRTSDGLDER